MCIRDRYKGYPAAAQQQVVHDTDRRVAGLDRQIAVPLIGVPGELLLDPSVGEGEIKADQGLSLIHISWLTV